MVRVFPLRAVLTRVSLGKPLRRLDVRSKASGRATPVFDAGRQIQWSALLILPELSSGSIARQGSGRTEIAHVLRHDGLLFW